jgi:hypothetical protein
VQSKTEPIAKLKVIEPNSNLSFKIRDSTKLSTRSKNLSMLARQKSNSQVWQNNDYELQNWFSECVRAVKKEIANRKVNAMQLNLNAIHSIDEFRTIDKLKLL